MPAASSTVLQFRLDDTTAVLTDRRFITLDAALLDLPAKIGVLAPGQRLHGFRVVGVLRRTGRQVDAP